jgi:ElaB/YqjD/DUF883 family membrane-anchored ribosome-binding protein
MEKADARIAESIHKMSRATAAVADALDDGIDVAKRVGKRSSDAAEELMDDATQRIKRHPAESLVAAFAAGVFVGGLIDCLIRRR